MHLKCRGFEHPYSNLIDSDERPEAMDICEVYSVQSLWQKTRQLRRRIGRLLLKFITDPKVANTSIYYDLASSSKANCDYRSSYSSYDRTHFEPHHFSSEEAMRLWLEKRNNR